MSKRGENIFKRKDGRWEARYEKSRDPNGKILYGYCYGRTYKEAKNKAIQAKSDIRIGKSIEQSKSPLSFAEYVDEWLEGKKNVIRDSSFSKYEIIAEKHLKPVLGRLSIFSISQSADSLLSEHFDNLGLSAKMRKDIIAVLRAVCSFIRLKEPVFSSDVKIGVSHSKKEDPRVLSSNEFRILMQHLTDDMDYCKLGIALAAMTGMRIGEICALKWGNISVSEKVIKIDSTMQRVKDYTDADRRTAIKIGSPKSYKSVRTIPINDFCNDLCKRMLVDNANAYVLTGTEAFIEPRLLQYKLKKITASLGLDGVHFHTLRHSFATRCIEAGFETKSLSEILGHASVTITMERYVHSSLDLKRINMEKLKFSLS